LPVAGFAQSPSTADDSDYTHALSLFHTGDYKESIAVLNRYLASHPRDARALVLRGDDEASLDDTTSALRDYDAAIGINPDYAYAYVTRCETRLATANDAGALTDCNTAVQLDPGNALAYEDRGDVYFDQSNYPAALNDYDRAVALGRSEAYIFGARCDTERLVDKRTAAAADCAKALAIDPQARRALWANARLAMTGGDYAGAIGYLNTFIAQRPKDSDTGYYYRGFAYNRRGDYRAALSDLQIYVGRAPDDPDGYFERGVARSGTGDREGAIADLTQAVAGYHKAGDDAAGARATAALTAVRAGQIPNL
jgi:tetratricopeptide (TPR) repeat protein